MQNKLLTLTLLAFAMEFAQANVAVAGTRSAAVSVMHAQSQDSVASLAPEKSEKMKVVPQRQMRRTESNRGMSMNSRSLETDVMHITASHPAKMKMMKEDVKEEPKEEPKVDDAEEESKEDKAVANAAETTPGVLAQQKNKFVGGAAGMMMGAAAAGAMGAAMTGNFDIEPTGIDYPFMCKCNMGRCQDDQEQRCTPGGAASTSVAATALVLAVSAFVRGL